MILALLTLSAISFGLGLIAAFGITAGASDDVIEAKIECAIFMAAAAFFMASYIAWNMPVAVAGMGAT